MKQLWLMFIGLYCSFSWANDVDELSNKLQQFNTMAGGFEQVLTDAQGEILQQSSGQFILQRPGYFRWETIDPFPQLLISNLKNIWLYDPDLEQVTIKPYDQDLSASPALLINGQVDEINRHYSINKVNAHRYELRPKLSQELFTQLVLEFRKDKLHKMVLLDSLSQQTTFTFINAKYNTAVKPEQFEFVPPKGTDVIEGS